MQHRLSMLSLLLVAVSMATFTGCWRKKCCKPASEESSVERVEENTCRTCPAVNQNEDEGDDFVDEEFPAESGHAKERVSGPRGWKRDNLK